MTAERDVVDRFSDAELRQMMLSILSTLHERPLTPIELELVDSAIRDRSVASVAVPEPPRDGRLYRLTYDAGLGSLTVWEKTLAELLVPNGIESLLVWMLRQADERGLSISLEST